MKTKRGPRDLTLVLSPPWFRSWVRPLSFLTARFGPWPRLRHASVRTSTHRAGLNRRITGRSRRAVIGLACLLPACQTPPTRIQTVEVKVPVAVQPITPAQVPTPPTPLPPRPSSLSAAADVLLSQVCKLEAYVLRADPLLRVSAGEKATPLPKYPECEP